MSGNTAHRRNGEPLTVAIPRVLWWFRWWPFWKTFFEGLACCVVTNDPARPTPRRHDRASTIVEEACYPIQLLIDRTLAVASEADAVFMPRLISSDPCGIMCPRFSGVPDIVQLVLGDRRAGCQPAPRVFAPIIDARLGRASLREAYGKVAAEIGVSSKTARQAFRQACAVQRQFESEFEVRLNQLPTPDAFVMESPPSKTVSGRQSLRDRSGAKQSAVALRVALLGHPYVTFDWEFNLRMVEKLRSFGLWVLPVESVPRRVVERCVRKLDKNVYWSSGRHVLGAALSFFQRGGIDGVIYLSCFKCGVDGLLSDVVRWAARHQSQVPYLSLTLDGHDNEMGLMTRLEAFADIVRRRAQGTA